jgi:1-acyl-sn-glycerol-3-phosphate acyltransferase
MRAPRAPAREGEVTNEGHANQAEPVEPRDVGEPEHVGEPEQAAEPDEGSAGRQQPARLPRGRAAVSTESWARTPPARVVRGLVQRGVLVPTLRFVSPFTVIGKRNLAQLSGPAVFVANHQSHFDAPICLAALGGKVRRRLVIAAAADYFYSSAVKGAAASLALGTVPFVRTGGGSRESLAMLKDLVGKGWSVLIFPSGTRGTGASGFKKGFAYIAVDAQAPVVPMYLHGLDRIMPKGSFIPLPGGVAVGIGAPIPPGHDYADLVRKAEAGVAEAQAVVKRWEGA